MTRREPFPVNPLDRPEPEPTAFQHEINSYGENRFFLILAIIGWIAMCYA